MSVARRESPAEGPNRVPIGTSCRLRCWASAQVRHAAQAQTLGDFSESLPTGCEEATQQTALAQFFQPCLPGLGRRPDSLADSRYLTRDRGFALSEQPPDWLRSFSPSPSKNARRTQRVTQWYQRVTEGSIRCARAMVTVRTPRGYHRANRPNPKDSLFTDSRSLSSRMTKVNIALPVLAF